MQLSSLLENIYTLPAEADVSITGVTLDSRSLKKGNVFIAFQGTHSDGRQFITNAITQGASAVLSEADEAGITWQNKIPIIAISNLSQIAGQIAANFYQHPVKSLRIIGITGTNGKTSCSHFIATALQKLHLSCGVIGTLGNGLVNQIKPSNLTTPDAVTLQALFAEFIQQGAKAVSMEVSSHSLDQGRVNQIPFEIGIFTNLTRDHLDYHGSMANYGAAKKRLFDNPLLKHAVINADDEFGRELIASLKNTQDIYAYSTQPQQQSDVPLIYADQIRLDVSGLCAKVYSPWGEGELQTQLIGQFNLSNLLATLTTLCLMGIEFKDALYVLSQLKPVPGRMELLGGKNQPTVVVDYSHTPDALEKALLALRAHCEGELFCLFGCGGDRDKGKRPIMAKIAEQFADRVVVTDDNPRHEDPKQIVADIMQGFLHPSNIIVQHDRSKAIQDIIQCAKPGDCILVAGKGAETYQQIGDKKLPFNDVGCVEQVLGNI